jgi:hypothetical protein
MCEAVIFTDIDGVYNTPAIRSLGKWAVEMDLVRAVADIANKRGARVVVTSSWRYDQPEAMRDIAFPFHDDWRTTARPDKVRGEEIREWLGRHPEVTRYAILDDWADFLPDQMPHLIHTDASVAITTFDLWRLDGILNAGCAACGACEAINRSLTNELA